MQNEFAPLTLVRSRPDMGLLARWASATRQRALRQDAGYALHAALNAALGAAAPKPFMLVQRADDTQLVGYARGTPDAFRQAQRLASVADPAAAQALGLHEACDIAVQALPDDWRTGESLSFETCVAPVVRSRQDGRYPEVDAAFHPLYCGDAAGDREAAYGRWLAQQLQRDGAASLVTHRIVQQQMMSVARRTQRQEARPTDRHTHQGLLPLVVLRGQLRVESPAAFHALLGRGLGRHRSFGFGCLLVAPPGAWA